MPQPQDNLARELRAAVLAHDHDNANRLTVEYCEALRVHWMTLSDEERTASCLPKRSLELLNWVRDMTLVQQALAGEHLALVERARRHETARALYLSSANLDAQY